MMHLTGQELAPFISGMAELEPGPHGGLIPHRLPAWARAQVQDKLFAFAEPCPTGVTMRCETESSSVMLTLSTRVLSAPGISPVSAAIVARQGDIETVIAVPDPTVIEVAADGSIAVRPQPPVVVPIALTGAGPLEILMPQAAHVEIVALEADTSLTPVQDSRPRWTHYGSSISHGTNAVDPSRTWPMQAAHRLGWNLRNLAFSGNAQLDPFVARVIRDTESDVITLKVGINLVNADSMRERTFRPALHGFLDLIREGRPETPIIVMSAIACPIHEGSPGPVVDEGSMMRAAHRDVESDLGALTLCRTREIVKEVVTSRAEADSALAYYDGRELFGSEDSHLLYDRLHPDQEGLDLIAARFVEIMRSLSAQGLAPRTRSNT